ncbi:MAG TPA: hypothetical protein VGM59_15600 [Dongiaceae bacterium]
MRWGIIAALVLGVCCGACQTGSADSQSGLDADDSATVAHDKNGDRIGPSYRADDDPRITAAVIDLIQGGKARCGQQPRSCIVDRVAAALPLGKATEPYCASLTDFADNLYCLALGAASADAVERSQVEKGDAFIREAGHKQQGIASVAAQTIIKPIVGKCSERSIPAGCAPQEMAARLGLGDADIARCAIFKNDWKTASCLMIGYMAEVMRQATSKI